MMDELRSLREENESLRERVRQMRDELASPDLVVPRALRLTPSEEIVFRHLLTRDLASRRSIAMALWSDRSGDEPDEVIISVHICRLRRKLRAERVTIENVWGRGWSIPDRTTVMARFQ